MIKILNKIGLEGHLPNTIKGIYEKHTANIILNGNYVKAFLLRPGTSQGCLFSPLFFNTIAYVLARANQQEKE
uniref:Reverse transcriptase domain-containing protein n=2 Tax=Canis lupus familiaris TaxID=9615 RepID=A0A8P0PSL9_CANLF